MLGPSIIPVGGIYACLFSRGDGTFHWAVIVPTDKAYGKSSQLLLKFHAKNDDNGWSYECVEHSVEDLETRRACVLLKIGSLAGKTAVPLMQQALRPISLETPPEDSPQPFTCRIWFKQAIRVLNQMGMIRCPNVNGLEFELKDYGAERWRLVETGRECIVINESDYSQ